MILTDALLPVKSPVLTVNPAPTTHILSALSLVCALCLHPELECDGHPQCHPPEDEGYEKCFEKYLESGKIKAAATLKCRDIQYPQIYTAAVVCDGVKECHNGVDEPWLCTNLSLPVHGVLGGLLVIILFMVSLRCFRKPVIEKVRYCNMMISQFSLVLSL